MKLEIFQLESNYFNYSINNLPNHIKRLNLNIPQYSFPIFSLPLNLVNIRLLINNLSLYQSSSDLQNFLSNIVHINNVYIFIKSTKQSIKISKL